MSDHELRIEQKLDLILRHLGISGPDAANTAPFDDPQLRDFMSRGRKIEAIKRYRELTGASLKEAKDAMDRRM